VPALPNPRVVASAVAGSLATLVLVNLAQLPTMEGDDDIAHRAFVRHETGDMAELGLEFSPTTRRGRVLYLALNLAAPGVDVVLGPGTELDPMRLYSLGRVATVVDAEYDPTELAPELDVTAHVVADDEGQLGPVPFTIALADDRPETLVVRLVDDRHDLIDVRLLPEGALPGFAG
jgi:hypothetical protein